MSSIHATSVNKVSEHLVERKFEKAYGMLKLIPQEHFDSREKIAPLRHLELFEPPSPKGEGFLFQRWVIPTPQAMTDVPAAFIFSAAFTSLSKLRPQAQ